MDEQPKPSLETHERLLKGVRQEVRSLQGAANEPGQSAKKLALLAYLERSARAEVKLRVKALAYARSQVDKPVEIKTGRRRGSSHPPNLFRKLLKTRVQKPSKKAVFLRHRDRCSEVIAFLEHEVRPGSLVGFQTLTERTGLVDPRPATCCGFPVSPIPAIIGHVPADVAPVMSQRRFLHFTPLRIFISLVQKSPCVRGRKVPPEK